MYNNYELLYLEYQEKLKQSRKNYRLNDLPRRRMRLPSWKQVRALLFL